MNRFSSPLAPPTDVPFQFLGRKILKRGDHLSLVSDTVQAPGRDPFDYEASERKGNPRIITVLPVTKKGEALLIWQYRIPLRQYALENVAGLVDEGMTPVDTVVKEIREETGYSVRVSNVLDLNMTTPTSSGSTTEKVECFAAFDAEPLCEQKLEAAESIKVVRLPLETAFETVLATAATGVLVDSKVLALLAILRGRALRSIA